MSTAEFPLCLVRACPTPPAYSTESLQIAVASFRAAGSLLSRRLVERLVFFPPLPPLGEGGPKGRMRGGQTTGCDTGRPARVSRRTNM